MIFADIYTISGYVYRKTLDDVVTKAGGALVKFSGDGKSTSSTSKPSGSTFGRYTLSVYASATPQTLTATITVNGVARTGTVTLDTVYGGNTSLDITVTF